jgi:hypothetical protein
MQILAQLLVKANNGASAQWEKNSISTTEPMLKPIQLKWNGRAGAAFPGQLKYEGAVLN